MNTRFFCHENKENDAENFCLIDNCLGLEMELPMALNF